MMLEMAVEVGYMEKIDLIDVTTGKPTGEVRWVEHPDQGFKGFLKWLVQNNSSAWVALMRSLIPHQVNLRTEKVEPVKYRPAEEMSVVKVFETASSAV